MKSILIIGKKSFIGSNLKNYLKKYLTYYRQLNNSASKEYKTFSKIWWLRRKEAHDFFSFISEQLKVKKKITLDKIITNLVNLFYK